MVALVIANILLVLGAAFVQYEKGSALLEAELKMQEITFRETEMQLTVDEMRADFDAVVASRRLREARRKSSIDATSLSISHTAATAFPGGAHASPHEGGRVLAKIFTTAAGKKLKIAFDHCHYPCFVLSLTHLNKLSEIITHEDAMTRQLLDELTPTSMAPSCAFSFFISQNWYARAILQCDAIVSHDISYQGIAYGP